MHATPAPYPFSSGAELLEVCEREGLRVSEAVMANEVSARPRAEVLAYLDRLRDTMTACIEAGMRASGTLPGGLGVRRRAKALHERLIAQSTGPAAAFAMADPLRGMDWVDLFALAVNEENAAGHRVVTAPTNGAAGVLPAVLLYYERFIPGAGRDGVHRFLLAATAVGSLIKMNASIAGAEVGCQGEVGSASSMAATSGRPTSTACSAPLNPSVTASVTVSGWHRAARSCTCRLTSPRKIRWIAKSKTGWRLPCKNSMNCVC